MLIIGLTGSIGMGKTTAANYFAGRGVPVFSADAAVHAFYEGEAVPLIEAEFPGTSSGGKIDREKLRLALGGDDAAFEKLESIIHPLVRSAEWRFLKAKHEAGASKVVLDIPLLFETGGDKLTDVTIVMTAPADIQFARVMARTGMTVEKFARLSARQMPDAEKRARASFVVNTEGSFEETFAELDRIMAELEGKNGVAFERWRALYEPRG